MKQLIRKSADFWSGIVTLILAVIFFIVSLNYDYVVDAAPGPGFLPRWISGILILLGVIYLIGSIKKPAIKEMIAGKEGIWRVANIFLATFVFAVLLPYAGFTIASTAMIFLLFRAEIGWIKALISSIVMSLALYYLFVVVLKLSFATNMLGF